MKNDPSFNYSGDSDKTYHTWNAINLVVVSVPKTESSGNRDSSEASDLSRCPMHYTRQSLNE